jgi:prefoldin alpha subunit
MPKKEIKSNKLSEEDKQGIAVEYELMRQEVANIDRQIQELQFKQVELLAIKQSAEAIQSSQNKELLVPLGTGFYINSSLSNNKTVLVNVGAGVVIEKKFNDAIKIVDEQIESIGKMVAELDSHAEEFINRMHQYETMLSA